MSKIRDVTNEWKCKTNFGRVTQWFTPGDEQWLRLVEMNTTDRSIVLVESINESPHPVIPELDHTAVKTRQDPWPLTMETQSLDPIALRLKLRQHPFHSIFKPYTHQSIYITYQANSFTGRVQIIASNLRLNAEKIIQILHFATLDHRKFKPLSNWA